MQKNGPPKSQVVNDKFLKHLAGSYRILGRVPAEPARGWPPDSLLATRGKDRLADENLCGKLSPTGLIPMRVTHERVGDEMAE